MSNAPTRPHPPCCRPRGSGAACCPKVLWLFDEIRSCLDKMAGTWQLAFAATFATLGSSAAQKDPIDLLKPEMFVRSEDQERARHIGKPCAAADVGRGCHRYNDALWRDTPCSYLIDADTIGSLPTDQCFKMEEARRFRGVWINDFEGQAFIPEGTKPPEWPADNLDKTQWRKQFDVARAQAIWLDMSRVEASAGLRTKARKVLVEFIGRKTAYPGFYGHMGMSGHEIIVDQLISAKPVE